ncbi:MAG: S9 family peptidase, partial [Gemmatimonadales bacterium]
TLVAPVTAQVPELSVERIYASSDFEAEQVQLEWMSDGRHYTTVERDAMARTDLYRVDIRSGERERLVRGADLVPAGGGDPIRIEDYTFSADGTKLLIATGIERIWRRSRQAYFHVWDLEAKKLTPISTRPGRQMYAKLSPDGGRVAFVRDNDLWVTDLSSGAERALTEDGSEDIINGAADWVYEEELSLADAFRWSPDGRRIAFWRFDQSAIPPFYLIDEMTLYPQLKPVRYPKAGTANSKVRLGVVDVAAGATRWIEPGPTDEEFYIARMDFANSSDEIWFRRLNRHQNRMDLYLADVRTGRSKIIMSDTDDAWIDIDTGDLIWIENGEKFVYLSERDGYGQLFLFERDGTLVRKLTAGGWDVLGTYGVDERRDVVYFTGAGDGPLVRPLYVVGLDGEGFRRISGATGTHRVDFDPTFTYYVDTYSQAGVPPVQTIRRADGEAVRTLADNAELGRTLGALELSRPEFLTVPVKGGVELNAWLIKPPDFDAAKTYPLLMYVYGGPGSQTVTDGWGGDRYLWHQLLAQTGYLVASVDNRGTGARGVAFKKVTYLNLGKYESADQIAAARYFGSLPYVDAGRIGIWGWSYGGYMSSLSMFKGEGVFKTAIAVAPVTDWRLYDTIYTERYMRTPQENPDGYKQGAPQAYADRLQGHFLLVHGTGDDNVHPQNSYQLVERLEEANKQFHFRIYPNKAHGIRGETTRRNLFEFLTRFVVGHL